MSEPIIKTVEEIAELIDNGKLKLPKYQRKLVWSRSKKKSLISSIESNFPIGAVLFAGRKLDNKWQLLDGQQRLTTLIEHYKKPFELIDIKEDFSSEINLLCGDLDINPDIGAEKIALWYKNGGVHSYDVSFPEMLEGLGHHFSTKTFSSITNFKSSLFNKFDISGYKVVAMVYNGPEENYAEAFERININGKKLEKYEILISNWVYTTENNPDLTLNTKIVAKEIISEIENSYKAQEDAGWEFEDSDEGEEFTFYEYLSGFGSLLSKKYPVLFGENSWGDITYDLFCICHKMLLTTDNSIIAFKQFNGYNSDKKLDPSNFQKAVIYAFDLISAALGRYLNISFGKNKNSVVYHTKQQLASMCSAIIVNEFSVDKNFTKRDEPLHSVKNLKKNLQKFYLLDTLDGTWKSAANTPFFNRSWVQNDSKEFVPSNYYYSEYPESLVLNKVNSWFNDQDSESGVKRKAMTKTQKLVYRFVSASKLSVGMDQLSIEFDHIIPVNKLKGLTTSDLYSTNHIANFMASTSDYNKRKKDMDANEFFKKQASDSTVEYIDEIKDLLLMDPLECKIDPNNKKETYREFIDKRSGIIKELLINELK